MRNGLETDHPDQVAVAVRLTPAASSARCSLDAVASFQ
jgi:hypothetical protein